MSLHADAVASLRAWRPDERRQDELRGTFLDLLERRPDALERSCAPAHLTASALVIDPPAGRVCLVLHAKVRRWLQPGGHAEASDLTLADAALREAVEETGIAGLSVVPGILHVDRHPAPCRPGVVEEHFDVRYLVIAPHDAVPAVSAESLDVRWFGWDDLGSEIEATIHEMTAAARRRLGQRA